MQEYQKRVVDEQAALSKLYDNLTTFIDSPIYAGLSKAEQERLVRQLHYMGEYYAVLGERIAAFDA